MILRRFYEDNLAQASYLIGCSATGEALIVDPNRSVDTYINAAHAEGLRVTHVTETHIHADFLSGLRELCAKTGARAFVSGEGGTDWQYGFADADNAVLLHGGDTFMVGNIRIDALHTPGHTPEHLTFLVTDTAGADRPMGALTGDFIFAGDVGRPDLLERAAGMAGSMEAAARQLYDSLQIFREHPDYLQLWPGHGAGSACGKALGAIPQTTLGYERLFNWAFANQTPDAFVAAVLDGQPEPPRYFAMMKSMNRAGPAIRDSGAAPLVTASGSLPPLDDSSFILDIRPWADYAREHVRGAINIPLDKSFLTWAGWLIPYDRDVFIIGNDVASGNSAMSELAMIGLDRIAGLCDRGAIDEARAAGRTQESAQTETHALRDALGDADTVILDVRNRNEWQTHHLPLGGAARVIHIPLGLLHDHVNEIPRNQRVLVHCKAGGRSAIATSILEREGFAIVENVRGGFDAWIQQGLPTEAEAADVS